MDHSNKETRMNTTGNTILITGGGSGIGALNVVVYNAGIMRVEDLVNAPARFG